MADQTKTVLTEEDRKTLSHRRIYWAIVLIDVLIAAVFLYEVIDLFVH
jgi:hypothetical protein